MKITTIEIGAALYRVNQYKQKTIKGFIETHVVENSLSFKDECFYLCDIDDIIEKHEALRKSLPRVLPFYGVRANNEKELIKLLAKQKSIGFDCASKYEMDQVLSLGVLPDRIILSNPMKPNSHILAAANAGVNKMIFDSENQLEKIRFAHPKAKLLICVDFEENYTKEAIISNKFGCNPRKAMALLMKAKKLRVSVIGISIRINHNKGDQDPYEKAFQGAQQFFAMAAQMKYKLDTIDIGGGFPGNSNDCLKVFENIKFLLVKYFPKSSVKFLARPGRYYVQSAFTLTCIVHSLKEVSIPNSTQTTDSENKEDKLRMYYITDGIYRSFGNKYLHKKIYTPEVVWFESKDIVPCCIWGPTSDPLDVVVDKPISVKSMGFSRWVTFYEMGAYAKSRATAFNCYPMVEVICVTREDDYLVRYPKKSPTIQRHREIRTSKRWMRFKYHVDFLSNVIVNGLIMAAFYSILRKKILRM